MTTRLRYRVTIERENSADGAEVPTYATFLADVPCDIVQVSGGEIYRGRQIEANASHMISMRYIEGVLPTMRLVQGAVIYNISKITRRNGRDHMLDIQASEVVV